MREIKFRIWAFYLCLLVIMVASFMTGYTYRGSAMNQYAENEPFTKIIINNNSEMIHHLGITAATQSTCTGLILEISDELRLEEEKLHPPKTTTSNKALWELYSDFTLDDDVPLTYEQILLDQGEIDRGIKAMGFGNIFQEEALKRILEEIKNSK